MRHFAAWPRLATLLLCSAFCLLPNLAGIDRTYPINVDASWMMGLTDAWQHGQVSGRDVYSTYGLLFQVLGSVSSHLHAAGGSAYDSVLLLTLLFNALSLVAFGAVLWALGLPPRWMAACYGAFLLLSVYQGVLLRVWIGLLAALLAAHAVGREEPRRRLGEAVGAGLLALAAQLLTFEMGIYAVAAAGGALLFLAVASHRGLVLREGELPPSRRALETAAVMAGTYAGANVLLALFFWATGPAGGGLLTYHRLMLAIASGYSYAQSLAWGMDKLPTVLWFAVLAYSAAFLAVRLKRFRAADLPLLATLAVFSVLLLKSAVVRADFGHISLGSAPALLLFLLLGRDWVERRRPPAVWMVLFGLLVTAWPSVSFWKFQTWVPLAEKKASLAEELRQYRTFSGSSIQPLPPALAAGDRRKALLAFPYQNYLAILAGRQQFAPIIQAYQANRRSLEQFYVEQMERYRGEFEVLYSFDSLTAHQFEDVQQVSRNPFLFEHLATAYRPVPGQPEDPGYLLLEPRPERRELPARSLPFKRQPTAGYDRVELEQPAACALIKLSLEFDYPLLAPLGRASQVEVEVGAGGEVVLRRNLFAIEGQKEFDTYLSLIDAPRFREIWTGPPGVPGKTFDHIAFHALDGSLFAFRPNAVTVKNVACVNP